MSNITLSMPEDLLKQSREYARKNATSLNALIRDVLQKTVAKREKQWGQEVLEMAKRCSVRSNGKKWKREDLYDA